MARGGMPPDLTAVSVPEIPRVLVPITLDEIDRAPWLEKARTGVRG